MRTHPILHPCTQMKDHEALPLANVIRASGSLLYLQDGSTLIDATSSWWCKSLGHQHPRLKKALRVQLEKFEHVILAGTINETILALSNQLTALMPALNKILYASDGSSAVEMAIKMSLHARKITGDKNRQVFLTLQNSYHGETIGALSVSDAGLYATPYKSLLFHSPVITGLPSVNGISDPLWLDCEPHWQHIEKQLAPFVETATAVMVEPIVQAAAGMRIHSQDFLRRLRAWSQQHDVHLIADEIATGMGRTGKLLACEQAGITPDFICLGKGLTSGMLPLSATLTTQSIYDLFYDDYHAGNSFLHSHTHSGNALAAAVALEVLSVMKEESICERAETLGCFMRQQFQEIADKTGAFQSVRQIGAIVAADLNANENQRLGFAVYQQAMALGALLRPLGNTIYWLPPLNTSQETIIALAAITERAISAVYKHRKHRHC